MLDNFLGGLANVTVIVMVDVDSGSALSDRIGVSLRSYPVELLYLLLSCVEFYFRR